MKWIKRQKVAASLTDFKANLSVLGIFQVAEDAVTELMGELKIDGMTARRVYNAVWVFAKNKIRFFKEIPWNHAYTVECFISRISRISIDIDVAVQNGEGELCAYSRTELCALDMETGKLRKVSTVGVTEELQAEEPLTECDLGRLKIDDLPAVGQVKIQYTNIDYVVHTNNKEYVRFMLNTYSLREMEENPIREMEISYINQSFEGDLLTVQKGIFEEKECFVIRKGDQIVVRSEISRKKA